METTRSSQWRSWQNSTSVHDKNSYQSGRRGNVAQHNKSYLCQAHIHIILDNEKLQGFLLKSETRQGGPLSPLLLNAVLEVLDTAIRKEKETKGIQVRRETAKLSRYADNMTLYIETSRLHTKLLLKWELIKNSAEQQDARFTYRNQLHVFALTMKYQKGDVNNLFQKHNQKI